MLAKIRIPLLFLSLSVSFFILLPAPFCGFLPALEQALEETTIRNVTGKTVRYSIKPVHSNEKPDRRTLDPGQIDRFFEFVNFDVTYKQRKKTMSRRIYHGRSYSFRLNEKDELYLYDGSHGRTDAPDLAPYVPTPMFVVEKMLQMGRVDSDDILYDLGCGDGRIVIAAAEKFGARGVGIDIDPARISESRANAILAGVENRVRFMQQDVMKVDFSEATVITVYLLPESLALIRPLLERMLKPGTYVVSHDYSIRGWEEEEIEYAALEGEGGKVHTVYVYRK